MPSEGAKGAKDKKKKKATRPRCHTCNKPIHVPAGWSAGPAVRKHYWKHHPAVMEGTGSKKSSK